MVEETEELDEREPEKEDETREPSWLEKKIGSALGYSVLLIVFHFGGLAIIGEIYYDGAFRMVERYFQPWESESTESSSEPISADSKSNCYRLVLGSYSRRSSAENDSTRYSRFGVMILKPGKYFVLASKHCDKSKNEASARKKSGMPNDSTPLLFK